MASVLSHTELIKQLDKLSLNSKDPWVKKILSEEPSSLSELGALDEPVFNDKANDSANISNQQAAEQRSQQQQNIKTFQEQANGKYVFSRASVSKEIPRLASGLTPLILALPQIRYPQIGNLEFVAKEGVVGGLHRVITIFLPKHSNNEAPLSVRIALGEGAKVQQVIEATIRIAQTNQMGILHKDVDYYSLYIADHNGLLNEGWDPLEKTKDIYQFNFSHFAIQRDPEFKPKASNLQFIKILLPDSQYLFRKFDPDEKLKELIEIVCSKRSLDLDEYCLYLPWEQNKSLPNDITLGEVTDFSGELCLRSKEPRSTVQQYKEFEVLRLRFKNFSKTKQESIIGIDRDEIHLRKKSSSVKKTTWRLNELETCNLVPEKKDHFILKFDRSKDLEFESALAEEIVEKISLLKQNLKEA